VGGRELRADRRKRRKGRKGRKTQGKAGGELIRSVRSNAIDSYELDGLKTESRTEKSNLRERDERIGIDTHAVTAAFRSKQAAIERDPRDRSTDWAGIGKRREE
jgi:hypothetical protein